MLKGNQKKLDKNNNNRIDAQDFKLLRAGKKRGGVMKAAMGAAMIGKKMVEDKMPGAFQVAKMKKKALGFDRGGGADTGKIGELKSRATVGLGRIKRREKQLKEFREKMKGRDVPRAIPLKAKRGRLAGQDFSERMKNVEKGLINKKTGKPTSMQAMRELKGFQPGELPKEFNARRKALQGIKKAAGATTVGKIALGIAGAGLAAKAFLDKKKKEAKEKKQNKKMGGGMMKRPMGYNKGSKLLDFVKTGKLTLKGGNKINVNKAIKRINLSPKDFDLATMKPGSNRKMMGGGMMQLPTGYDKGGGADSGTAGKTKKGPGPLGGAKGKKAQKGPRPGGRPQGRPNTRPKPSAGPMGAPPKEDKGFELKYPGPARPGNPVVVYSVNKGSMVKARGGGLAKTKPTKMY